MGFMLRFRLLLGLFLGSSMLVFVTADLSLAAEPAARPPSSPGQTLILNEGSYWRYYLTARKPVIRKAGKVTEMKHGCASALPPADRTSPDFNDHLWGRLRGPFFRTERLHAYVPAVKDKGYIFYEGTSPYMALLSVRGRFLVRDPKTVGDLALSLVYRGGVVVYLNGKEVARGHLPDTEKKGLEALAEDYPPEACQTADGKPIGIWKKAEANADRLAKRLRRLTDVKIPAANLRQGVNVLAVEVHRAPYSPAILKSRAAHNVQTFDWLPMGLVSLSLESAGSGAVPNVARPRGLQVWAQDPSQPVGVGDYDDPAAPDKPVRIAGARNGTFSGQIVVCSAEGAKGLKVQVGDLKGAGTIPAEAVQVRWALKKLKRGEAGGLFDALSPAAVTELPGGAVQPVFLSVRVPRDAKAGAYSGKVAVSADGAAAVEIPIELSVADWTLPDPKAFQTQAGLAESPESVAMQYKVDFWSEKHWQLLEQVFALMEQVGADDVYLPLERQTSLGNAQSMVRWIPKAGGGYTHDFSIVERYLDLAVKHLGKPPIVCLIFWDKYNGFRYGSQPAREPQSGVLITTLDPKTGKLGEAEGPKYGTPGIREFWRPVAEGMRKVLKARGLEDSMMLGIIGDLYPPQEAFEDLTAVMPGVKWVYNAHQFPHALYKNPAKNYIGYYAYVYANQIPAEPGVGKRLYGWRAPLRKSHFPRMRVGPIGHLAQDAHPGRYRVSLEALQVAGFMGFGRVGMDFWPVVGRLSALGGGTLGRRYLHSDWHQLSIGVAANAVVAPGADGPLGTVRFEGIRASAQECEARMRIERALLDPAAKAKLGKELAERCQSALDERQQRMYLSTQSTWFLMGWQERAAELYGLAGEVAKTLSP